MLVLIVCLLAYGSLWLWVGFHRLPHWPGILLAFQYFILLPVVIRFLRSKRGGDAALPIPWPTVLIGGFLAAALILGWWTRDGLVISDESAYRFQARIFSLGRLWTTAPPSSTDKATTTPAPLFFTHHILVSPRWFTKYPPGWPFILALPERFGVGWLLNPLLAAVLLCLIFQIAREFFDRQASMLAVFFSALSPYLLANSVGFMSHTSCAVLVACASLLFLRGLRLSRASQVAAGFALLVYASLTRPLSGLLMLVVFVLFGFWSSRQDHLSQISASRIGIASLLLAGGLTLIYNKIYSGAYWLSPYALYKGLSTPPEITLDPRLISHNLLEMTRWSIQGTVLWTFPFLFVLAGCALIKDWRRVPGTVMLAALFPGIVVAHTIQTQTSASLIGERYYFEAFFAVTVLAGRGFTLLVQDWKLRSPAVFTVLLSFGLLQLGNEALAVKRIVERSRRYGEPGKLAHSLPKGPYLVFFTGPSEGDTSIFVPRHFNLNRADWQRADVVFLVDPGPSRRPQWACRFNRQKWVVIGFDETKNAAFKEFGSLCPDPRSCSSCRSVQ